MKAILLIAACLALMVSAAAQQATTPKAAQTPTTAHASQSPKAVLQAYISAWNRHDLAAFDALLAPDGIHEDIPAGFRGTGPAQVKDFVRDIFKSQPDLVWKITSIIESGSIVAAEWTWTSTYTGDGPSGPVVAQRISSRGASIAVVENGRIKRFTDYYDTLTSFAKTTN